MRVSFLGTGIMGAPMATNLVKAGFDVTVWNRTAAKAARLAGEGARPAPIRNRRWPAPTW